IDTQSQSGIIQSQNGILSQRSHVETETERLYGMPGKAWIYTHTSSYDVSVDATVINSERELCMVTLSPARGGVPPLSPCLPTTPAQYLILDPVIYLIETKWLQPLPVRMRTDGKGKKQLDVIETEVGRFRVDFYLDRKTRLPVRLITEWFPIGQATIPGGLMTVELEDYVAVDGIPMPRPVTSKPQGAG